jgi:hypothetical protein
MPKTSVSCPNCRQPIPADIDQLFDVNQSPDAKQRLLSGAFNYIQCPVCGYQGNLATPIVYHDPEKELLLTFTPSEIGLPRDEQEKVIGGLINSVVNNLPQEKRKGYLFQPQAFLTLQSLIEKVLEADGITREMIDAQQERLKLIQRLVEITDEGVLEEVIKQEDALIDADFFGILTRLVEASAAGGDQNGAQILSQLHSKLVSSSSYGKEIEAQSKEVEAVVKELQALGENVTREDILEMIVNADNEIRLQALTNFVRPIMDYSFFQLLSERVDQAEGDEKRKLEERRAKLLELTSEIDKQVEEHVARTRENLEKILEVENLQEVMAQYMPAVDEFFIHEVTQQLDAARQQGDLDRSSKLQSILDVVDQASAPPAEFKLVEDYLEAGDAEARQKFLEDNADQIGEEFINMLANLSMQVQDGDNKEMAKLVTEANRQALRFSMSRSLGK